LTQGKYAIVGNSRFHGQRALPYGRQHAIDRQALCDPPSEIEPVEASAGENGGIHDSFGDLTQTRVQVAAQNLDAKVGTRCLNLASPAQTRSANPRCTG
jgi:hypothetical protein